MLSLAETHVDIFRCFCFLELPPLTVFSLLWNHRKGDKGRLQGGGTWSVFVPIVCSHKVRCPASLEQSL